MLVVAFTYFLFLYIDIRLHVSRAKKALKDRELRRQILEDHISKLNVGTLYFVYLKSELFNQLTFYCTQ